VVDAVVTEDLRVSLSVVVRPDLKGESTNVNSKTGLINASSKIEEGQHLRVVTGPARLNQLDRPVVTGFYRSG
jgi:hypothetical protein